MADQKIAYGSASDLTITLASLATSSTHLAGRESTAIDNTSNLYLDYLLSGKITVGTSPTDDKRIRIFVYGSMDDTPNYPDVFDGTDSAETVTSAEIRQSCLHEIHSIATDNTSDRTYWIKPRSIAMLFGGVLPKHWGVFVTHDTGVNLNSTAGNQKLTITPIYSTVA